MLLFSNPFLQLYPPIFKDGATLMDTVPDLSAPVGFEPELYVTGFAMCQ
jgi:hypothetical protein